MVVAWGVVLGTQPLSDNSFFTHLATGRLILDRGSVPTTDPYSFTAAGTEWVVQSWLASVLYAAAEELAGPVGIRILVTVLTVTVCLLLWSISRPAVSLLPRLATVVVALVVSADSLSERPLLFGLIGFLIVLHVGEDRLDPRWLIPVFWVWVNTHGSFPLGIVYLLTLCIGRWLDDRECASARRALGWAFAGVLLGAVSPIGPRILIFPIELLSRQEVLSNVLEWQAPTFDTVYQQALIVLLAAAVMLLVRVPRYARAIPLAVFVAAALLGARNLTVLSFVCVLVIAEASPEIGSLRASARTALVAPVVLVSIILIGALSVTRLKSADYAFQAYPVRSLAFSEKQFGPPSESRLIGREIVGNFRELIHGDEASVFTDDRFDMYPSALMEDVFELTQSSTDWQTIISRYHARVVVWHADQPLGLLLTESTNWSIVYTDELWVVAVRRI